jgi:hypothetical protein
MTEHESHAREYGADDGGPEIRFCEHCGKEGPCEEIPMMGYSCFLCRQCAAAAYRLGEAV